MKKLNSVGLVLVLVLCLSVTSIYAADETVEAKPQAAKEAVAAKAAATAKAANVDVDMAQVMQGREAQLREEIRRKIRVMQEGEIGEDELGPQRDPGEGEPIEINDIQELQRIGNHGDYPLDGNYILANEIDASITATENWLNLDGEYDGKGFDPIGDGHYGFSGVFRGNNHVIRGLTINRPEEDCIGLFAFAYEGVIENVRLVDIEIVGRHYMGGIVGDMRYSFIFNSSVTGNVRANGGWVGGLAGGIYRSLIADSYAMASVNGNSECLGGLVGVSDTNSIITGSYAAGNVTGGVHNYYTGGLVGANIYSSSILNSYATGNVTGGLIIGGLVGYNLGGDILYSYATGRVEAGDDRYAGGLVGEDVSEEERVLPFYEDNYFDTETTGLENGIGANMNIRLGDLQGKTTAQMKQQETFENWDLGKKWRIDERRDYPRLQWEEPRERQEEEPEVIEQTINLRNGWNIISFYVEPEVMSMRQIIQPLIGEGSLLMVKDEAGHFIAHNNGEWLDTGIGDMSPAKGYYVRVNRDTALTIEGTLVELPLAIPLRRGVWNLIGYPVPEAQLAMDVLQQLADADAGISFTVKDSRGRLIVYQNRVVRANNLRIFEPGQGYQIRVDRDVDLVISAP